MWKATAILLCSLLCGLIVAGSELDTNSPLAFIRLVSVTQNETDTSLPLSALEQQVNAALAVIKELRFVAKAHRRMLQSQAQQLVNMDPSMLSDPEVVKAWRVGEAAYMGAITSVRAEISNVSDTFRHLQQHLFFPAHAHFEFLRSTKLLTSASRLIARYVRRDLCSRRVCSRCTNNSTCQFVGSAFKCACGSGFRGKYCSKKVAQDCTQQPCKNNGTCAVVNNFANCKCAVGFYGRFCGKVSSLYNNTEIREIKTNIKKIITHMKIKLPKAQRKALKKELKKQLKTEKRKLKKAKDIWKVIKVKDMGQWELLNKTDTKPTAKVPKRKRNPCKASKKAKKPCKNRSKCVVDAFGLPRCICRKGFTGPKCKTNIDDCKSKPCQNNGKCVDKVNNFKCNCPLGYGGKSCSKIVDVCKIKKPCMHEGMCTNKPKGKFACVCKKGYEGASCQQDHDDCASKPCGNGGICIDLLNDFKCKCQPGWSGKNCTVNIDDCASNPCKNNGACTDKINDFKCKCPVGFKGKRCQINIDDCASRPCKYGKCIDKINAYKCKCPKGLTGRNCEINIDDCKNRPCMNGGKCVDKINNFTCNCPPGWTGRRCQINIDDCASSPCRNNGTCIDGVNAFKCRCPRGFSGIKCQRNINDCLSKPCKNGAKCLDGINSVTCKCKPGFAGRFCQIDINECDPNPCKNGATCQDLVNGFACKCPAGYKGKRCSKGKKCKTLKQLKFGRLRLSSDRFPASASYRCEPGYKLEGKKKRKCLPTGKWTGKKPKCVGIPCSAVAPITNGNFTVSNKQLYPSVVSYTCAPGYKVVGAAKRICMPNGKWAGEEPKCKGVTCRNVPDPLNGRVVRTNEGIFPSNAVYRCNPGFKLVGKSKIRECGSNGRYSGRPPVCKPVACSKLNSTLTSTFTTTNNNSYPSIATYKCLPGYRTIDPLTRHCNATGQWSGIEPRCTGVPCSPLAGTSILFVNVSNNGSFPAVASYKCKKGYVSKDEMSRTCKTDGTWSGKVPACVGVKCAPLNEPDNGAVAFINKRRFPDNATYTCNPGYTLTRSREVRRCKSNGKWTGAEPKCVGIKCTLPPKATFGSYRINSRVFPTTVSYRCDPGYFTNDGTILRCLPSGEWSGAAPRCQPKQCSDVPPITNGKPVVTNRGYFPSQATFKCDAGYELLRKVTRKCKPDGSWSGASGVCGGRPCDSLGVPDLAGVKYTNNRRFPSTAIYTCKRGYTTTDSRRRKCRADGTFDGSEPRCQGIKCDKPTAPRNGVVKTSNNGLYPSVASYNCSVGFTLVGATKRSCRPDGSWTEQIPSCRPSPCPDAPSIKNGYVIASSNFFPSTATYSCKQGYKLASLGQSQLTCTPQSTWAGTKPKCVGVDVKTPPKIKASLVTVSSQNYPAVATYSCKPGYKLVGKATVKAAFDGSFAKEDAPRCKPIRCNALPDVPASNITRIGGCPDFPCTVKYTCLKGYKVKSGYNLTRVCGTDGKWSGLTPVCEGVVCPRLNNPNAGYITTTSGNYPASATYVCNKDFVVVGNKTRKCTTDGTWDGVDAKCVAECKALPAPPMGNVSMTSTTFPSRATYTCKPGCTMIGGPIRDCASNGVWQGAQPTCQCLTSSYGPAGTRWYWWTPQVSGVYLSGNWNGYTHSWNQKQTSFANKGDTIVTYTYYSNPNSFVGTYTFGERTFNTGSHWKCSQNLVSGWHTKDFDDSTWLPAEEVAPQGFGYGDRVPAEAQPIRPVVSYQWWTNACRFKIGGFDSWSIQKEMYGYATFKNPFWGHKAGNLSLTGEVRCRGNLMIGLTPHLNGAAPGDYLLIEVNPNKAVIKKMKILKVSASEVSSNKAVGNTWFDRSWKDDKVFIAQKTEDLSPSGSGDICDPGSFKKFWVSLNGNKLSFGKGDDVGSDTVLTWTNDFVKTLRYFGFSKQSGTNELVTFKNLKWGGVSKN